MVNVIVVSAAVASITVIVVTVAGCCSSVNDAVITVAVAIVNVVVVASVNFFAVDVAFVNVVVASVNVFAVDVSAVAVALAPHVAPAVAVNYICVHVMTLWIKKVKVTTTVVPRTTSTLYNVILYNVESSSTLYEAQCTKQRCTKTAFFNVV